MLGASEGHYCEHCILAGFLCRQENKAWIVFGIARERLGILPLANLAGTRCITARRSANLCSSHMLRTEADPDQSGRNSPQNWPAAQELQGPRKGQRFSAAKDPANHVVLYDDLEPLRGLSRKIPTPLDGVELAFGGRFSQKF